MLFRVFLRRRESCLLPDGEKARQKAESPTSTVRPLDQREAVDHQRLSFLFCTFDLVLSEGVISLANLFEQAEAVLSRLGLGVIVAPDLQRHQPLTGKTVKDATRAE
jgi:hypothetical protein